MKRVRPGEYFAIEGLWMTNEEAALVKQELLARRIKQAERLAQAIGFPSREWQSGSSFDESYPVNAAALREALVCLRDAARDFCHQILNSKYNVIMDKYTCCKQGFPAVLDLRYAIPKANFAIFAPPRNCDVGTAEEQYERYKATTADPFHTETLRNALNWAQMLKESEAAK